MEACFSSLMINKKAIYPSKLQGLIVKVVVDLMHRQWIQIWIKLVIKVSILRAVILVQEVNLKKIYKLSNYKWIKKAQQLSLIIFPDLLLKRIEVSYKCIDIHFIIGRRSVR